MACDRGADPEGAKAHPFQEALNPNMVADGYSIRNRISRRDLLLGIMVFILAVAALRASYYVTMPLFFAFFFAALFYPIQKGLDRRLREPFRTMAVFVPLVIMLVIVLSGAVMVTVALRLTAMAIHEYAEEIGIKWDGLPLWLRQRGMPVEKEAMDGGLRDWLRGAAWAGLISAWSLTSVATLIFVYTLLMLAESVSWQRKARQAFGATGAQETLDTVHAVAWKIRKYIVLRTLVSLATGIACGLWLWITGVNYVLLWAFIIFLLNHIPNIGSVVAIVPPTLVAMLDHQLGWALVVLGGLCAIQLTFAYVIEPRLLGHSLHLSPSVIIVSLVFWSWVWGMAGVLLAVPMTAMLVVVCGHVEALRPIAALLGDADVAAKLKRGT